LSIGRQAEGADAAEVQRTSRLYTTVVDTVLLKVASRCNLDCGYCYVYRMGDTAWRLQPKLMPRATIERVAEQLTELYVRQAQPLSVVLHGGEPLLLGAARLRSLCVALRAALPHPCGINIQTNGTLLTDEMLDTFVSFDVGISISIDGPVSVHDRFRLSHRGRGSYERVRAAIDRVVARDDARPLFAGVLAVIDPTSDAVEVYEALKSTGAPSLDFLVRDGHWDHLPFGKSSGTSTEYGRWLGVLLDRYLADSTPPRVRILDDMLRLLLGGVSQKEGVGTTDYGILVIEPDGRIDKNDTLKIVHAGADRFDRGWSIFTDRLVDIVRSPAYADYFRQQRPTAAACGTCSDLAICGGGMVAHRWSAQRGFDNPTVFCADQKYLIGRMRSVVGARAAL
jgi:uncharacterized protein